MSDTMLKARIKIGYDTMDNWTAHDPVLLSGEVAIVEIAPPSVDPGTGEKSPAVLLFKVGDGLSKFSQLGWGSALAADVYDWAKQAEKPTYSYSEIKSTPTMTVDESQEMLVFSAGE